MDDLSSSSTSSRIHNDDSQSKRDRQTYIYGIGLLLIVVFLWTSSNFVTQDLFDGGYNKPFLVTYLNTSSFTLYLASYALRRAWRSYTSDPKDIEHRHEYEPLTADDVAASALPTDTACENVVPSRHDVHLHPLTTQETAILAILFCFPWFLANWALNASLQYTSVASATILSSMSGFFTLCIGRIVGIDAFTVMKVSAVFASFCGVVLVSLSDSSLASSPPTADPALSVSLDPSRHHVLGDVLALLSAFLYALYVTFLKVRIRDESRVDMQLFFGFVGAFNTVALWPMIVILHFSGVETFAFPHSSRAIAGLIINMAITLSSDFLYVLSMLKTSPLVVTIGLSLTMPLAVVGDVVLGHLVQAQVVLGAVLVLAAFAIIGVADSQGPRDIVDIKEGETTLDDDAETVGERRTSSRVRFQEETEIIDVSPLSTAAVTPE